MLSNQLTLSMINHHRYVAKKFSRSSSSSCVTVFDLAAMTKHKIVLIKALNSWLARSCRSLLAGYRTLVLVRTHTVLSGKETDLSNCQTVFHMDTVSPVHILAKPFVLEM